MSLENGAEWFDKWTIVKIIAEVHNSSAVLGDLVGCGIGFRIPPYRSLTKFVRFKNRYPRVNPGFFCTTTAFAVDLNPVLLDVQHIV